MGFVALTVLLIAQSHDGHDHDHSAHGHRPDTLQVRQDWVDAAHDAGKVRATQSPANQPLRALDTYL